MTMAVYSWAFLLICPVVLFVTHGSGAVTNQDEFILIACGNNILSGGVDGTDFTNVFTHSSEVKDVAFDPFNEKIYFVDGSTFLYTVDPDGTNNVAVLEDANDIEYIDINYKLNSYLYYMTAVGPSTSRIHKVHLNDINRLAIDVFDILKGLKSDFISYRGGVDDESGMIFYTQERLTIGDINGNPCTFSTIPVQSVDYFAFNYDDSLLYTILNEDKPTVITSHAIGTGYYDRNFGQINEDVFDDDTDRKYRQANMKYYDGYLYVAFGDQTLSGYSSTPSKLGRFSLLADTPNSPTSWEYLASSVLNTVGGCQNLHIYNPLDVVFQSNRGRKKSAVVKSQKKWRGGFIADVSFKFKTGSDELTRIELAFPRQVFNLEIVGCDLEQESKEKVTSGQRKGSTYTLSPNPESTIEAGKDGKIRFTVMGTTFRKLKGFKAPIIADVYYVPGERKARPDSYDPQDGNKCTPSNAP